MRILCLLLIAGVLNAGDPPFKLPRLPVPVAPAPPPGRPDAPLTIDDETSYAFDSDSPLIVLEGVKGLITIDIKAGPASMKNKWADDVSGVRKWREFKKKHVYFIDPAPGVSGELLLLVSPSPAKAAEEFDRLTLVVRKSAPKPDVVVDPVKPVVKTAAKIHVVILEETGNRTAAIGKVLLDPLWIELSRSGNTFTMYDKDDAGSKKYITTKPLPAVLVFDQANPTTMLAEYGLTSDLKNDPASLSTTLKNHIK